MSGDAGDEASLTHKTRLAIVRSYASRSVLTVQRLALWGLRQPSSQIYFCGENGNIRAEP